MNRYLSFYLTRTHSVTHASCNLPRTPHDFLQIFNFYINSFYAPTQKYHLTPRISSRFLLQLCTPHYRDSIEPYSIPYYQHTSSYQDLKFRKYGFLECSIAPLPQTPQSPTRFLPPLLHYSSCSLFFFLIIIIVITQPTTFVCL